MLQRSLAEVRAILHVYSCDITETLFGCDVNAVVLYIWAIS